MKILVAGRDGQVGQALVKLAVSTPLYLIALSRGEMDITDPDKVQSAISKYQPDVIINAAAYTAVDRAEDETEQAYKINEHGTKVLASECENAGIPLLHISTDFVFDGEKAGAYSEIDSSNPLSVYGKSKLAGEVAALDNCSRVIIMRTSWVFGGAQNFVSTMRRLGRERDLLNVVMDQRGGPTCSIDIAAALLKMAQKVVDPTFEDWGIFHFSGAPVVSWYEFACEILKDAPGVTVSPIPTSAYPTPAVRPANSVLNCAKIQQVFGIAQPDWKLKLTE